MLNAVLSSLSHAEDEIREASSRADATLRALLQSSLDTQFEMHTLMHSLSLHLGSQHVGTLVAALGWVPTPAAPLTAVLRPAPRITAFWIKKTAV